MSPRPCFYIIVPTLVGEEKEATRVKRESPNLLECAARVDDGQRSLCSRGFAVKESSQHEGIRIPLRIRPPNLEDVLSRGRRRKVDNGWD